MNRKGTSRLGPRGRVKELPPPDARSQQELSEVAEAPRSGGSSKKWRKLDQVGEKNKFLSKCSKKISEKILKTKKLKESNPSYELDSKVN